MNHSFRVTQPILVTGANGQVGFELTRSLQGLASVVALDRNALDLADPDQIRRVVRDVGPSVIVNAAAYTAVDRAENDEAAARSVNSEAPGILAEEARRAGALLVHYSTDYVFDGHGDQPFREDDATGPLNVYGRTKLAGEQAIAAVDGDYFVFRTSWVYGTTGSNFLRTMLRLGRERDELSVVADQIGAPTWSGTIAVLTGHILARYCGDQSDTRDWWREHAGVYHLTNGGETSWHGFAKAIFARAGVDVAVHSITSEQYPVPAARPRNSRLSGDKLFRVFGLRAPQWEESLARCLREPGFV
ncbi:TPA: dTDP-4-dehydrorhamnose reductase [Burkholderia vietnamiensis]|uniref:dTDP-4-dehydrorhamnose reductase n=1 Tax=Burkholderia vietnamiensis TaxID=60552 RepID=A0ABS1AZ46_BURVI|nr:dTDP-4-dehydrorhamnose reductase [Burkholderia vietnamiensis]AOK40227.1 dTDP-4-dehydrorhamnose reductase [Burkholderia vietnamiensis]KVF96178.1 dTDP-4-dehydrorhamnose reductase [Burkholderia vietnamiensis]MBJ9688978.1 dTDP-4-dehydrorhamnose reductase [Burkholderia vietnamiensis]MBR8189965.1 dTDP-4-dehydrorhamnose reductase [Burkholderia vietnamiensis]MCA8209883.1 dTDP-4-dehydrorhamnose reductase [Burkholderia vietnamiensis]